MGRLDNSSVENIEGDEGRGKHHWMEHNRNRSHQLSSSNKICNRKCLWCTVAEYLKT